MCRWLWIALLSVIIGCNRERPPAIPYVGGPDRGQPGETLTFWAVSTDPNRDNIAYLFNWGDESEPIWSAELPSGETMFFKHIYQDTGRFGVTVQTRDEKGNESPLSDPFYLNIQFFGPITPLPPAGPRIAYPDTPLVFITRAGHIRSESVAIEFNWGDNSRTWTEFVPSGESVSLEHIYRAQGKYYITCRAKDRTGNLSPWSLPESILVDFPPLRPPENLRLAPVDGIFVHLSWEPGRNHTAVLYGIWWRPAGSESFILLDTVNGLGYTHNPDGVTGDYTISARFRCEEVFARETISTLPVQTDTIILGELNTTGNAGYGWDLTTFLVNSCSMSDTNAIPFARFYLTDFSPESLNLIYFLASPHLGPDDPGGVVPPGNWHRTWFCNITGNTHLPLPEFDSAYYRNRVELLPGRTDIAVYLPEDYYALLSLLPLPETRMKVISYFQPCHGLRLIYPERKADE